MKPEKGHPSNVATLRIDGEFTIYRATELKPMLLNALGQSNALEIDLSAVTELDTSGVQLLILAKKEAHKLHKEMHLVAHSPAVLEVFDMLDLTSYFGDPIVIPFRADKDMSEAAQ